MACQWTDKPLALDGADAEWSGGEDSALDQIDARALNNAAHLYLRLISDGADGRALLSGVYRQDVTVWFLGKDGKTRDWAVQIPFSELDPPTRLPRRFGEEPSLPDVTPRFAELHGLVVSTAPLPSEISVKLALSGKDTVLEIGIPLEKIRRANPGRVPFDVVSSQVTAEVEEKLRSKPKQHAANNQADPEWSGGAGGSSGGGRRGMARGSRRAGPSSSEDSPPPPINLKLSVRLASAR